MKKQVFTLMTTLAVLSASPVLAMDYNNNDECKEVKRPLIVLSNQPTLPMIDEIEKHGSFFTTDGAEYKYESGSAPDDLKNFLQIYPNHNSWAVSTDSNGVLSYSAHIMFSTPIPGLSGDDNTRFVMNSISASAIFKKIEKKKN